jgi:hypothetical protein
MYPHKTQTHTHTSNEEKEEEETSFINSLFFAPWTTPVLTEEMLNESFSEAEDTHTHTHTHTHTPGTAAVSVSLFPMLVRVLVVDEGLKCLRTTVSLLQSSLAALSDQVIILIHTHTHIYLYTCHVDEINH